MSAQRCARRVPRVLGGGQRHVRNLIEVSGIAPRRFIMCRWIRQAGYQVEWKEDSRTRSRSLPESTTTPAASTHLVSRPRTGPRDRSISDRVRRLETSRRTRYGNPLRFAVPGRHPNASVSRPPGPDARRTGCVSRSSRISIHVYRTADVHSNDGSTPGTSTVLRRCDRVEERAAAWAARCRYLPLQRGGLNPRPLGYGPTSYRTAPPRIEV